MKIHQNGKGHQVKEQIVDQNQREFISSNKSALQLSLGSFKLSQEDQIRRAEFIHAFKCVDSNYSFASSSDDRERFQVMFPDWDIAKAYQQGETKMKYSLQYGIAPYIKENLINGISNTPFSFKFDETTTSQVKKQYDAYAQYWQGS